MGRCPYSVRVGDSLHKQQLHVVTRSTGTVNTSANLPRHILPVSRYGSGYISRSVTWHYPDLWPGVPLKFNHLFVGALPTFPENSCKSVWKFLCKIANKLTNRQTNRNNDDYICSLAEVIMLCIYVWQCMLTLVDVCFCLEGIWLYSVYHVIASHLIF